MSGHGKRRGWKNSGRSKAGDKLRIYRILVVHAGDARLFLSQLYTTCSTPGHVRAGNTVVARQETFSERKCRTTYVEYVMGGLPAVVCPKPIIGPRTKHVFQQSHVRR